MAAKKVLWRDNAMIMPRAVKKSGGFTLFELVIALAVLMLVSGGVFMALRQSGHRALRNAAIMLQADLQYINRRSVMEGSQFDVQFEPAHNRYRIRYHDPVYGWQELQRVYFQDGVRLPAGAVTRVHFTPRGTSGVATTIYLDYGRNLRWAVIVNVSGGRVRNEQRGF